MASYNYLIMQINQLTISAGYSVTLSEYGWKNFFLNRGKICFVKDSVQGWKAVGRQLEDYKEKRSRYENLLVSFDVHYAEMYMYTLSEFTSF